MFDRLKVLYSQGKIDNDMLDKAVALGWITEVQKAEIIGDIV